MRCSPSSLGISQLYRKGSGCKCKCKSYLVPSRLLADLTVEEERFIRFSTIFTVTPDPPPASRFHRAHEVSLDSCRATRSTAGTDLHGVRSRWWLSVLRILIAIFILVALVAAISLLYILTSPFIR
jgi:hypothetical protein